MRTRAAITALLALFLAACQRDDGGRYSVVLIGDTPSLVDPSSRRLTEGERLLLANVAQGLVRFDANGSIVPGLAERWTVSDDGLSYIFRLSGGEWANGRSYRARDFARILKRQLARSSDNSLRDTLGAVTDVVAMTDRVIEIRLAAPRPNLLQLLAQPEFGLLREGFGTGPFAVVTDKRDANDPSILLRRTIDNREDETSEVEEVRLVSSAIGAAVNDFAAGKVDLVLGGTVIDLPYARTTRQLRRDLTYDPVLGLFGFMPGRADGPLAESGVRRLLAQAIDREAIVSAIAAPGLTSRAMILQPGLQGLGEPIAPAWAAIPLADRRAALAQEAKRLFGSERPTITVAIPAGIGGEFLLRRLKRDWGVLGFPVERAANPARADVKLVDMVAPSSSPAWFLRQFRCGSAPICSPDADKLLDQARLTLNPRERAALFVSAAAMMDDSQFFMPIAAPVRWSLVGKRVEGFAGNAFAAHPLTGLGNKPAQENGN